MKFDVIIKPSGDLRQNVEQIKRAEALGFDAAWIAESAHNPYLLLTVAAKETARILLGTRNEPAFLRSPMITAQLAWDLARQSGGRFILGLGSHIPAHIGRPDGEAWSDPAGRMREYIESLRAIWNTFQTDARLRYRGQYYQFRLMAPFFNPGPIANPEIPIFLAGDNADICRLAGHACHGLHARAFHSPAYLRDVLIPAMDAGLQHQGRSRSDIALAVPVLIVSDEDREKRRQAEAALKTRMALCAGGSSFRRVMRHHGWEWLADELQILARAKRWDESRSVISDDVLSEFAIKAAPGNACASILDRYAGLADRVCLEWDADNLPLYEAIAADR